MKLYMSALLNIRLIFCVIHVKYEAILKIMLLYLVEKVWLSRFFLKIWFSGGGAAVSFEQLKLYIFRQIENIYFCNHEKSFFTMPFSLIRKLNISFIK